MKSVRNVFLACAFILLFAAGAHHAHASTDSANVKVQVNDELIQFPDGKPFADGSGRIQVPVRFVSEKLGYDVNWNETDRSVTIASDEQTVKLTLGSSEAVIDDEVVSMDTTAVSKDARVYVPIRVISDTFDVDTRWDEQNRNAIINADGEYHESAWKEPAVSAFKVSAFSASDKLIGLAKNYMGTPYVWGGTTPNGFDCSGFVQYVFGLSGKSLPRTSKEMYQNAGIKVQYPDVGDLVFFSTNNQITHVGIYVGDKKFISATNSYGVHIDSLTSGYWGNKYKGAKRLSL